MPLHTSLETINANEDSLFVPFELKKLNPVAWSWEISGEEFSVAARKENPDCKIGPSSRSRTVVVAPSFTSLGVSVT